MTVPEYLNVTAPPYNAKGDGKKDDTQALVDALADAAKNNTSSVLLPGGCYYLKGLKTAAKGLIVPAGVTLRGVGWNTIGSTTDPIFGSWIRIDAGAACSPITISGPGATVRDLAIMVMDQPSTPTTAPPMVHVRGTDALIENVFLLNPYGGVFIDGVGRVTVRRLFGEPLAYGIEIDVSKDTNYIEDIHFYPYWGIKNAAVYNWQLANGKALVLCHCDNPHISNVFANFYNTGLSLEGTESATSPHKVHLVNADFDCCVTGISIQAMGDETLATNLQMANVTIQAPSLSDFSADIAADIKIPAGHGLWIQAGSAYATVQASNLRITKAAINAIRIDAGNATFYGENSYIAAWQGSDGIVLASSTAKAYLSTGFDYPANAANPCHPIDQFDFASPAASPPG